MVKIIRKTLDFYLTTDESHSLRSKVSILQAEVIRINSEIEELFQKLINNKTSKEVDVLVETDEEAGTVKEYYGGVMIAESTIPKKEKQSIKVEQPQTKEAQSYPSTLDSYESQEFDLLTPEEIDPEYDEQSLI